MSYASTSHRSRSTTSSPPSSCFASQRWNVSNRAVGRPVAVVLVGAVAWWMIRAATSATWVVKEQGAVAPTTYGIGTAFLTDYVLPYEVASLVLLVALIGAVVVSRKEIRS